MMEYADRVRSAAQELKALKIFDVENYKPLLQKLSDIHIELRRKPKLIANAAGNVMADEGTAEVFARALNELSGKDSPVPEENLRLITGTVFVLAKYTSTSLKFDTNGQGQKPSDTLSDISPSLSMTTLTAPYTPVLLAGLMGNVFVQVFHEPVTKHPLFVKDCEKLFTALPKRGNTR